MLSADAPPMPKVRFSTDPTLWTLLAANAITLFFALTENWNLLTVLWVYWFQSVTIGLFNFIRILQLKEFTTERLTINSRPAEPTRGTKLYTAFFFLVHYGFFHVGYSVFLLSESLVEQYGGIHTEWGYVAAAGLLFFFNHLFSYVYHKPRDTRKQNIGALMFYPYARIIPMHLTIIFGFFGGALPLFLGLKALADAAMHSIEHYVLRKGEALR